MTDPQGTPPVVDIDAIVAPLPGDAPSGADLRGDPDPNSPYRRLKAAREAARAAERAMIDDPSAGSADWAPVATVAAELLTTSSKDLEIAAWLIEALLRMRGFAGLRDGFVVARRLCETAWDTLNPAISEDEGVSDRVFPFTGLNGDEREGTLIAPIRMVRIGDGPAGAPFGLWHYERTLEMEKVQDPDQREQRISAGAIPLADLEVAVRTGDPAAYRRLAADVGGARDAFSALEQVFADTCGFDAPPGNNIRAVLEKCHDAVAFLAKNHLETAPEPAPEAAGGAGAGSGAAAGSGGGGASGPLQSREEAFRQLESVSDYFRRTEPHSPLSYSLEQAVRWGRMPLPDLLAEIIPDESARAAVFKLTGIRPPNPPQ